MFAKLRGWFVATYCTVDYRTLACFRVALGLMLIADLLVRARHLTKFYTNEGVWPNHLNLLYRQPPNWSFLTTFSTPGEVRVAFFCFGLVYVAFLVGWGGAWIRVAALASAVSLTQRNILIVNGGHEVLSVLLVWCLFLPLDEHFSVTSWRRAKRDPSVQWLPWAGEAGSFTSFAYFGAIWSLALIYVFNALSKTGDTWSRGQALHYVLNVSPMTTRVGMWVRTDVGEGVKWFLSMAALDVEIILPFLILGPAVVPVCRGLAVLCIVGLHGGIMLMIVLGIFPVVLPVYGLLLICPEHWDWLLRRFHIARVEPVDGTDSARTTRIVGSIFAVPLFYAMTVQAWAGYAAAGHANVRPYKAPSWTDAVAQYTHALQLWKMYAPDVPKQDYAYVIEGDFENGAHRDLVSGKAFDRGATTDLNLYFDTVQNDLDAYERQWDVGMNEAFFRGNPMTVTYYGRYWFKKYPDLEELWIIRLERNIAGVGEPQTKDVVVHLRAEVKRGEPGQFIGGKMLVRQAGPS